MLFRLPLFRRQRLRSRKMTLNDMYIFAIDQDKHAPSVINSPNLTAGDTLDSNAY